MNKFFLLTILSIFLCTSNVFATNITICDNNHNTTSTWYNAQEDQEVEPGMQTGQLWDLEGFLLDGTLLSLVGGYDFKNGESDFDSGDIFIDVNGDAIYGDIHGTKNENLEVFNTYGYDYVIDLNWDKLSYDVWAINQDTKVNTSFYSQNQGSNPWRYISGGSSIKQNIAFTYKTGLSDAAVPLTGGSHNQLTVDLSFLLGISGIADNKNINFITHYTMGCGNDNIMGSGTIPVPNPEPSTILLLGCGLLGIARFGRRKNIR